MENVQTYSRLRFACKSAAWHLLISLLVASAAALLVFQIWYPYPYAALTGGLALYKVVVMVDVVCGPLLTLILASPKKSIKERMIDFTLIGVIQLAALFYGLYSVSLARPVVVAFEKDRIMVVTAAEVVTEQLPQAPEGLKQLPWLGIQRVGLREPVNAAERNDSLSLSLQGVEPSMRPDWWLHDSQHERNRIIQKMIPLSKLAKVHGLTEVSIREMANVASDEQLYYLPFTSSFAKDWVVVMNHNADFLGYLPMDGFIND